MIRVIRWTAEVEIEGEEEVQTAWTAYRIREPFNVEGRPCIIVSADLRPFDEPDARIVVMVEEIRP